MKSDVEPDPVHVRRARFRRAEIVAAILGVVTFGAVMIYFMSTYGAWEGAEFAWLPAALAAGIVAMSVRTAGIRLG